MKRTLSALFVSILFVVCLVSCGGNSNSTQNTSGLKFRVFVSNPVIPSFTGSISPGLNIIDATKDVASFFNVSLLGTVSNAGMMVESPKRDVTVVFSPTTNSSATNQLGIVDNAKESGTGSVTLPGPTESMFVWGDNTTLYAAVPTAETTGQAAGAVVQVNISTRAITASIPIAGAHYLVPSPDGNKILAISDTTNAVTMIEPELISQGSGVIPVAGSFDKPVWAVFSSDGSTAYVMNCGAQCGGTAASISVVDMSQSSPVVTSTVPVQAATMGLLSGDNLYVAGTPLSAGIDCQANLCGVLSVFSVSNVNAPPATFAITDGYHDHMVMAPSNQLFIGSRTCTNVIALGSAAGRGCLSVFSNGKVYTAAQNGNVTSIQPIDKRSVVYVCQAGGLQIYDTVSDLSGEQLQLQKTQVSITGQAIDVKVVDF
ncbi:MAG TPA: hypothetical protein VH596_11945 [Terriglobales bacterium]